MLKRIIIVLVLLVTQVNAQDKTTPWALTTGVNIIDVLGGDNNFNDYLGIKDWNVVPLPSKITLSRYLDYGFTANIGVSLNSIDKVPSGDIDRVNYESIDLGLRYHLSSLFDKKGLFDPYGGINTGAFWLNKQRSFHVNPVAGFNLWINKKVGFNFESGFKYAFNDINFHPKKTHFQHSVSVIFRFGARDKDNDGVIDKEDLCIDTPGVKEFAGCPDTDGDGVKDSEDKCPNLAGILATKGCPDSDKDGIIDSKDACPNKAGEKNTNGCPDVDGDGVKDSEDKCPEVAGIIADKGCPKQKEDTLRVEESKVLLVEKAKPALSSYQKVVTFDFDSAKLKPEVISVLKQVVSTMKRYKNTKFEIEGHSDNVGASNINMIVSERRATNVLGYLIKNGIEPTRLKVVSFGEKKPIAPNTTAEGRQKNRRVVLKVY